jgi:hypothetical protein
LYRRKAVRMMEEEWSCIDELKWRVSWAEMKN